MERIFSEFSKLRESDKSLQYDWRQFKDPLCYMCQAMVTPWSLTGEVAGLKNLLSLIHRNQ